jgi:hypothetical protein
MTVIGRLLAIGSAFDWLSPLLALCLDGLHGPSYTFRIVHKCSWSGHMVASLLQRHGVHTWGLLYVGNTLLLTVRSAQARRAQHLLDRAGVPVENPLPLQSHLRSAQPEPLLAALDRLLPW